MIALAILFDVEDRDQIRMLQVQALRHATEFDFQIFLQQLDRDFFARISQRVIHLPEATARDGSLDRVSVERSGFRTERKLHDIAAFEL
jgi:hypothetical protein